MGQFKFRLTLDMVTELCWRSLSYPFSNLARRQGFKGKKTQFWKEARKNEHVLFKFGSHLLISHWSMKITQMSPESECGGTVELQDRGYE